MSAGLKIADINTTIARNLKRTDIKANLVTALSWDLGRALPTEENNREMCRILKNIKATVRYDYALFFSFPTSKKP